MTESNEALYDREKVDRAIARFREMDLNLVEAMLASWELAREYLLEFRKKAGQVRSDQGDEAVAALARFEINDLICELQDSIPPMVRTYNALLRDPEDESPGGQ